MSARALVVFSLAAAMAVVGCAAPPQAEEPASTVESDSAASEPEPARAPDMTEQRMTPQTPVNQSGPLVVHLFDAPAGAWTLAGPQGACLIMLEASAGGNDGAVIWPRCPALAFSATRWALEADGLVLRSAEGQRVATFRADMMPPLSGQSAAGDSLTLSRR